MFEAHTSRTGTADVILVGGGLAGLATAILMAQEGLRVFVLDRAAMTADPEAPGADLRTTALLAPAIETLTRAGVWSALVRDATSLAVMRMIDAGGAENIERRRADFAAAELNRPDFGANVANTSLKKALLDRAAATPGLQVRAPVDIRSILFRSDSVIVTLAGGETIVAPLVVGADGRDSIVREAAQIPARRAAYGQTALVFSVAHEAPHQNVSTEILRSGGPFTLVPHTPGPDGGPRSSVVWMERRREAERLLSLYDAAFEEAVNQRSLGVMGRLRLASPRVGWPVITQLADRFHAPRAALIAEAAHVVPPIGAQGLNMSLKDGELLCDLIVEARALGRDVGATAVLSRLTRDRWPDAALRAFGTAALNVAAIAPAAPLKSLRVLGLGALSSVRPLKHAVMRLGLGG